MQKVIDSPLVDEYKKKGFITIKNLLSPEEVKVLVQATERVITIDGPQVMREKIQQ